MTLTPEQLVNLIAAAEKFARAWEAADGTADDARDELTDVVTSIRASDYGVVRMPTETFANIQPAQELFCPDCDMAWTQHPNQACTNIPPRAAPGYLLAEMDTTPADVQYRIDQMQAAGTTAKSCLTRGCNRPRNHLGRCSWITEQHDSNPSETGL